MKYCCFIFLFFLMITGCKRTPRNTGFYHVKPGSERPGSIVPDSGFYLVKKGDSLWKISRETGFSSAELASYNGFSEKTPLKIGQKIHIPPARKNVKVAADRNDSADKKKAAKIVSPEVKKIDIAIPSLKWPHKGNVKTRFGESVQGAVCKGVEIEASALDPYHSAGDGEVIFSQMMENYGYVTIIRNREDLYFLYYAYSNRQVLKKGDSVRSGDLIGYVGKRSPTDSKGVIHFEVRKKDQAVNPEFYLQGKS